ncbi:AAA family ATPase [Chloroflexota bacterium]
MTEFYNNNGTGSSFNLVDYQPLSVAYQLRGSILHRIRMGKPVLPDIDGREETKADVIRALLSGANLYLVSEEGTGKTRLAKSLARLLPQVPIIRGCPYHDDPKWPTEVLCPRCRASQNPVKEFGIDLIPGAKRLSRIQGNEYTNEAKILGLKDIQAIANGKSPSDPQVFTGTGVFKANRGILLVDELPSIRTNVQVLFHPILEEQKAILEEYDWEHPLDLVLIATGNPTGFTHVNEIPRPLLDRLELIYMDLPEEDIEEEIMIKETFGTNEEENGEQGELSYPSLEEVTRNVVAPWWIMSVLNKSIRHSRICPYLEKKASIRATKRALDHTYASVEMENMRIANLRHVYYGLRLALRGRVGLRIDLIDFDNPVRAFKVEEELTADFMWNVLENLKNEPGFLDDCDRQKLGSELGLLLSSERLDLTNNQLPQEAISQYDELAKAIRWMREESGNRLNIRLTGEESKKIYNSNDPGVAGERDYSALEILANICVHEKTLDEAGTGQTFIPHKYKD